MKKGQTFVENDEVLDEMARGIYSISLIKNDKYYLKCRSCLKKIWSLEKEKGIFKKLNGHIKNCKFKTYERINKCNFISDENIYDLYHRFYTKKTNLKKIKDEPNVALIEDLNGSTKDDEDFMKKMSNNENYRKDLTYNVKELEYEVQIIKKFNGEEKLIKLNLNIKKQIKKN